MIQQKSNQAKQIVLVAALVVLALLSITSNQNGPELVEARSSRTDKAGLALDAIGLVMDSMKQENNQQGRFIYAVTNDGCLDGGMRSGWHDNVLYPSRHCPSEPQLKWRFDGRYLRMSQRYSHFGDKEGCLDCSYGGANCDVLVFGCIGGTNQQWFVKVFPHQVDTNNRRVTFSIMHYNNPNQCLTRKARDIHTFDHTDCHVGAHAAGAFSFGTAFAAALGDCSMKKPTTRWESYSLADCTGNADQSFYLDRNWFDELDRAGAELPLGRK